MGNEWQNINAMQLRYALQFILLQINKNKKQSQKQINIDAVILFLCDNQKFDGNDLKMNKCEFAQLLFENVSVCHCPSKHILQSLRDYKFEQIPTNYFDLCAPQIFKNAIRTRLELNASSKMSEDDILLSIQYKECGIPMGKCLKLHSFVIDFVEKNKAKYFKAKETKECKDNDLICLMSKVILPRFNEQ